MKEKIYVEIAGIRLGIVSEEGKEYVVQDGDVLFFKFNI